MFHLLSYHSGRGLRAGIHVAGRIFDVADLASDPGCATTEAILEQWDRLYPRLARLAEQQAADPSGGMPLATVRLAPPLSRPGQIYATGANYTDHLEAMEKILGTRSPNPRDNGGYPWFFVKPGRSGLVGHGADVKAPVFSQKLDYELELAFVIGRAATCVSVADALAHVAGYTVSNDLSARDMMTRPVEPRTFSYFDWLGQKGFDGSCPMGPWITPAAFIADPQKLSIRAWINDELRQDSHTSRMVFSIAEQLSSLSHQITLNPGDIVMTGTCAGVGMESGQFLKPGDRMRFEIEQIGILENRIV
jgi:2-keto-4-pentenoate hydratase/2-oxohepta-3-ene-1,7-dioic acid hydratase in catechol pathway